MDDFAINKRLAKIAGVEVEEDAGLLWDESAEPWPGIEWSPLTDWSQLGPLLESVVGEPDMMRGCCLAIIAAHDGG